MTGVLAIDTATDACSIALWRDGQVEELHEITPRQHNQRLFTMLRELLPDGLLAGNGIDAIAYGSGPGSFTGLRIAASAVQGLAFAADIPAVAVSTLACQAQTALRQGLAQEGDRVFSALDARINEIYYACFKIVNGQPESVGEAKACAPADVRLDSIEQTLVAVGSGCQFVEQFPEIVREQIPALYPQLLPHAQDLVPLALASLRTGRSQAAAEVQPVYVRDEINWKKIPEQGKQT